MSVKVAFWVVFPIEAVTVTGVVTLTPLVLMAMIAVEDPAATVTEAGTLARVLALDRETTTPDPAAAR